MHVDSTFQRPFFSPLSDFRNGLSFCVEAKLYHHDLHELRWKHPFLPALTVTRKAISWKQEEKELEQRFK